MYLRSTCAQDAEQQRRRQASLNLQGSTRSTQAEAQSSPHHINGNPVTYDNIVQLLQSNVGGEEEQVNLATELERLFGFYGRMN